MKKRICRQFCYLAFLAVAVLSNGVCIHAQDFFTNWFDRVTNTLNEQPHWAPPVVTVTPRLQEVFRYDFTWQELANGTVTTNYGSSKGLELIPSEHIQIIAGVTPYVEHGTKVRDGAGDTTYLIKYRLFAGNEQHGNYIVTLFFAGSVPTGSYANGATDPILTPTLAFGKGWRRVDFQSTLSKACPMGNTRVLGRPVTWNTAFQYRVKKWLWPEVEANSTFFSAGPNDGKKQTFLTPGLVFGAFPLAKRLGFSVAVGTQIAATQFHTSNHNWIMSTRLPF